MQTFFDNQIKPLIKKLDDTTGVKHIDITFIEPEKDIFGRELIGVPVNVLYTFKNSGAKRWMINSQIESMKMIGVLPR